MGACSTAAATISLLSMECASGASDASDELEKLLEWIRANNEDEAHTGGTATLMPPVCLQCGMPLNNVQDTYERVLREVQPAGAAEALGADPLFLTHVFQWLHKTRLCCRVNLSRSAADSRLRFAAPFTSTFVNITRASRGDAVPVAMHTDGTTRIDEQPRPEWFA